MTPAQLNQLASQEELDRRIAAVLAADDFGATSGMEPLAPFITLDVIDRLHDRVISARWAQQLESWGRGVQRAVTRVKMADLTGDEVAEEDAMHIGQDATRWVSNHDGRRKKAKVNHKSKCSRARQAGKELPANTALAELNDSVGRDGARDLLAQLVRLDRDGLRLVGEGMQRCNCRVCVTVVCVVYAIIVYTRCVYS